MALAASPLEDPPGGWRLTIRFRRILILPPPVPRDGTSAVLMTGLRSRYPGAMIDRVSPGEGIVSAARRARRVGYDLAIATDRSARSALVPLLAGIPCRIGPGSRAGRLLFSIAVPFDGGEGPEGRVGRILALLDPHASMPVVPRSARAGDEGTIARERAEPDGSAQAGGMSGEGRYRDGT